MKQFLLLVLLCLGTFSSIVFVAHRRSAVHYADQAGSMRAEPVDVDFTALSESARSVRFIELMMDPASVSGKTVRVEGYAYDREDYDGSQHAWLRVYDGGGCCPLLTVEYLLAGTNAPPREGNQILLEGLCILRDPPAFPYIIVSNATVRIRKPITSNF